MIPTSAKELLPFTPVEGGPTYQIAVPTLLARAAYRRDVKSIPGVRYLQDGDLLDILRDGVRAVVVDTAQGPLIDLIDNFEALADDPVKRAADTELLSDMAEIEETVGRHYAPYAEAVADREHWLAVAPIVAFKHFVRGWDGLDVVYEARAGRVSDACMAQVPESDILVVGYKCLALMHPSKAEAKNSESRSPSPSDRETLTAA